MSPARKSAGAGRRARGTGGAGRPEPALPAGRKRAGASTGKRPAAAAARGSKTAAAAASGRKTAAGAAVPRKTARAGGAAGKPAVRGARAAKAPAERSAVETKKSAGPPARRPRPAAAGTRASRDQGGDWSEGQGGNGNGLLTAAPIEDGGHLGVHGLGPAPEILAGQAAAGERSGKYVYCIMQTTASLRFGPIGIGSEAAEVHTVNYRDIGAVVSDTPLEVYDPTRENVLAHERVNEAVMRKHTVIPMSFNTVFKTREDIIELLRTAYDAFRDVLGKMEDKLEFGLKVVWDPELVIREIEKEDENLRLLRQEISSQTGSTYFARMQYGRLVDSLLQDRSEHLVSEIFAALSDVAVASRASKPIGDKMILNAAFLVARDRESDFDATVKQIDAKYANLKFKYTGPWPPYNFVNIRLKLERAAEAE
jgi:hypothetical protein